MTWPIGATVAGIFLVVAAMFCMLGLGGALVFVPLLHWLGFDLKTVAIPLGLALNAVNTGLALRLYHQRGLVDWTGICPMAVTVVLAAPVGALAVPYSDRDLLLGLLAIALLASAAVTLWRMTSTAVITRAGTRSWRRTALGGGGLAIGFLAGLLGLGGGFLVAPVLMGLGYGARTAAGSTALVVTVSSLAGLMGHLGQGHFPAALTTIAVSAVVIGSLVGSRLMVHRANPVWLGWAYAILLVLIAARLGWESLA